MERPEIALAATVHGMALQVFYNGYIGDTALQITAKPTPSPRRESPPSKAIEGLAEQWVEIIPGDPGELFDGAFSSRKKGSSVCWLFARRGP